MALKNLTDDQNQIRDLILIAVKVEKLLLDFPELFRRYVAESGKTANVSAQAMEQAGKIKALIYIEKRLEPAVEDFIQGALSSFNAGVRQVNEAYRITLSQIDSIEDLAPLLDNDVNQSNINGKIDPVRTAVNGALSKEFTGLARELSQVCSALEYALKRDESGELPIDGRMFSVATRSLNSFFEHISKLSKDYPRIFEGMFSHHQEAAFTRG